MVYSGRMGKLCEQLSDFELALRDEDWSEAAIVSYSSNVAQFGNWYTEVNRTGFEAEQITKRDVQEHRDWMLQKEKPSAAESVNRRLVSLRKFFAWLGVKRNPASGVKGLTIIDPGVQAISNLELRRLRREVHIHENPRDIAIVELLCFTGIRVGELVALRLGDMEIQEPKGKRDLGSGGMVIRHGKGRTCRQIPLSSGVRESLSAWLAVRPTDKGDNLFVGERGPMTNSGVWRLVRKYGDKAGIEKLRVHQLRHTVLTRLVREKGVDLAAVARISGHSSIKTLLRYAAPTKDDLERAMESLEYIE